MNYQDREWEARQKGARMQEEVWGEQVSLRVWAKYGKRRVYASSPGHRGRPRSWGYWDHEGFHIDGCTAQHAAGHDKEGWARLEAKAQALLGAE